VEDGSRGISLTDKFAGARKLRVPRRVAPALVGVLACVAVPAAALAQIPNPPSPPKVNVPSTPVQVTPPTPPSPPSPPSPPKVNVPSPPSNPVTGGNTGTTPAGGNNTTTSPSTGGNNTSPVSVGNNGVNVNTPAGNLNVGGGGVSTGGGNTTVTAPSVSVGGAGVNTPSASVGHHGVSVSGGDVTAPGVSTHVGSITTGDKKIGGGGTGVAVGTTQVDLGQGTAALGHHRVILDGTSNGAGGQLVLDPTGVHASGNNAGGGGSVGVGGGGLTIGGGATPRSGPNDPLLNPGTIGAHPGLGLFGNNPLFAPGGSAGIITADSPNALRPGAMGAYRVLPDILGRGGAGDGALSIEGMNARPGIDFPAGVLGIDPARAAAMYAQEGAGPLLTPAALVAQHLPASGDTGVAKLFNDIGDALGSVIAGLPDWSRPIILVLLALVLMFGVRSLLNGRRARLFRQHLAAERERNEILAEENLVYQRALVPALPTAVNGIGLSAAYRPADLSGAGGDFYDVFALDKSRTAIILGDVSGHDRRAVERANAIRHNLRAYLWDDEEPRIVLKRTGTALARDETLDGDFATAIVAVHDAESGTLTYACAGHPAPVLVGAPDHAPVSVCSSPALGWGIPTGRRQTTIVLGEADIACFYTDGLIEARSDGGFLGREGLEELVAALGATGTAPDLLSDVIGRAHEADDDLAALVLRAGTPTAPRATRVEELEVTAHDVRRKAPERFLAACGLGEDSIEQAVSALDVAVAQTDRAVLKISFAPGAEPVATVEPLGRARLGVEADDPHVLVGD
jgi:serine phosphatase RsbU (regulator of sigma subunit)